MTNRLVIWGTGGHGRVVLDVAHTMRHFTDIVFVDDLSHRSNTRFCQHPLIGPEELYQFAGSSFIIAIGDNHDRSRCFPRALEQGLQPATLVHTSAIVSPSTSIGPGTLVMPGSIVNAGAMIDEDCIINSGAIIEHDCRIDAHVHISPRAVLGGGVSVEQLAHVGMGSVVLPRATIGEEAIVGAGAVVLRDAPAYCTVVGVPAKTLSAAIPKL